MCDLCRLRREDSPPYGPRSLAALGEVLEHSGAHAVVVAGVVVVKGVLGEALIGALVLLLASGLALLDPKYATKTYH